MPPSPALPWEVIERVIDHSAKDTGTLYSFTLTCRDLRPRSTILLLGRVKLKTRNQLFDLCAVLEANPHLKPCVHSVSMCPHEFSPHPLLRMLPNLSEIEFAGGYIGNKRRPVSFHPTVLRCCRQLGQDSNIRTLSLSGLEFSSLSTFSDILLLFPGIDTLSCKFLRVKNNSIHQELVTRRLSERLHLTSLTINNHYRSDNVALLILLREVTKHRITTLTVENVNSNKEHFSTFEKFFLASPSDWICLSSFKWQLGSFILGIKRVVRIFKDFHPANLREVTVDFAFDAFPDLFFKDLPRAGALRGCAELEKTLLKFSKPTLSFSSLSLAYNADSRAPCARYGINGRRRHSWMSILRGFFPGLAERCALIINAKPWQAGHDSWISTPIVTSADSQWAVTGSSDGTIIIWDLQTGCISQDWFARDFSQDLFTGHSSHCYWMVEDIAVDSVAFSPDGRYIMSASIGAAARGEGATVWDLHQGARRVNTLMEENEDHDRRLAHINCAWSPDGSWIAAGPQNDGAIHIWETATFQRLHFHTTAAWKGVLLAFSADKSWIVTAAGPDCFPGNQDPGDCWIWSIESGNLHRSLQGHTNYVRAAAFNSESTRIVTGSDDSTVRIWDIETGEQLLVLEDHATSRRLVNAVAFSGDGRMVLSHSYVEAWYGDDLDRPADDDSGGAKVWDASNGALLASLSETRADFMSTPHSACFSPCGSYVASASDNLEATLWRTSDWTCIARVSGDGAEVTHVAISPDGRMLCWGTEDGRVFFRRMHDLISGN